MVKNVLLGLLMGVGLTVAASIFQEAEACPYCAQDKGGSVTARYFLIGGLVSFPFLVVGTGIYAIRRVDAARGNRS